IREAARVLRPGGVLVASDLHPVAGAQGWRRPFEAGDGTTVEAPAVPARLAEPRQWGAEAGLRPGARGGPPLGPPPGPHFRRAGRRDFAAFSGTPLPVVLRAVKGGHA